MSEREKILNAIASSQPSPVALPAIDKRVLIHYSDVLVQFKQSLQNIGATIVEADHVSQVREALETAQLSEHFILNGVAAIGETDVLLAKALTAPELAALYQAWLPGTLGVAENGAIWLEDRHLPHRLLPFICEHLVLVLERSVIVPTLHQAMERISLHTNGFGVFIAGPSKTADIEQSLVIGAHGARQLTVYLL
jgi:L-lactate dehydrogenase complex protein LldG